ncbi:TPA: hypothetical protein ACVU43_004252 [Vibrio parahaemolyticus]|nr:hypothetical protein [Vibrio parahaemolyticus]HBC3831469.1 hypothetical protein [Vibrio parahaemolyticus]
MLILTKKKERPTFLAILELAFDVDRMGRASQPTRYQYDDLVLLFVLNAKGDRRLATLFFLSARRAFFASSRYFFILISSIPYFQEGFILTK